MVASSCTEAGRGFKYFPYACRLLGVTADASQADIKSAYRKAALKVHPDVSNAPDATQQFSQLSSAYGELLHLPCLMQLC